MQEYQCGLARLRLYAKGGKPARYLLRLYTEPGTRRDIYFEAEARFMSGVDPLPPLLRGIIMDNPQVVQLLQVDRDGPVLLRVAGTVPQPKKRRRKGQFVTRFTNQPA